MCEWGFGYGESEYEVSFGLAPRNGELSPSVPETPEPFNTPFRALTEFRFELPTKFGVSMSKLGPGAYTIRDRRSMVKRDFFLLSRRRNCIFLTCEISLVFGGPAAVFFSTSSLVFRISEM